MKLGFQGSETSSVNVTIYNYRDTTDISSIKDAVITFDGKNSNKDKDALISLNTSKTMGESAGTFTLLVQPRIGDGVQYPTLDRRISNDAWIDIELIRFGKSYHVMRGIVEEVKASTSANTGATERRYVISGRDFGAIFSRTLLWFNVLSGLSLNVGRIAEAIFSQGSLGPNNAILSPPEAVESFLLNFLQLALTEQDQNDSPIPMWELPNSLPSVGEINKYFINNVIFNSYNFTDPSPVEDTLGGKKRVMFRPQGLQADGGNIWDLTQELSDPFFNEVWCDLGTRTGDHLRDEEGSSPTLTQMTVFMRMRPFPYIDSRGIITGDWFNNMVTHKLDNQNIESSDTSVRSLDRYNLYTLRMPSGSNSSRETEMFGMHLDPDDIRRHGMRRFYAATRYSPSSAESVVGPVYSFLRGLLRDWYVLNPYMHSGTLSLARFFPNIRIGSKVEVGDRNTKGFTTYYVESVSHSWTLGKGKTILGVTRGWIGSQSEYNRELTKRRGKYLTTGTSNSKGTSKE